MVETVPRNELKYPGLPASLWGALIRPRTRSDLSRMMNIPRSVIYAYLYKMIKLGFVISEDRKLVEGKGRPTRFFKRAIEGMVES